MGDIRPEESGDSYEMSDFLTLADGFLPDNHAEYTVRVAVTSWTGLSASASRTFTVDFAEPGAPAADVEADEGAGTVSVRVLSWELSTGEEPEAATACLDLCRRRSDGTLLALAEGVAPGAVVKDPYPPTDVPLEYVVTARSETGAAAYAEASALLPSRGATLVNFGEGMGRLVALALDPVASSARTRTVTLFETAGGGPPMAFYGVPESHAGTWEGTVPCRAGQVPGRISALPEADALARHVGTAIVRRPGEDAMAAAVSLSVSDGPSSAWRHVALTWQQERGRDGLAV